MTHDGGRPPGLFLANEISPKPAPELSTSSFPHDSASSISKRDGSKPPQRMLSFALKRRITMAHGRPRQAPLLTIVGATGTGKSNLAVSLAERFNGEIVNGDALQLYDGLPILTNKISLEDRKGIFHHLIGRIGLEQRTWTVGHFKAEAKTIIADIHARGKLPILVGGTHYYIQSLLFHGQTVETSELEGYLSTQTQEERWPILKGSGPQMLEKLKEVDPVMAAKWHPNDSSKIRRSLEIWFQTGRRASDIYAEQNRGSSAAGKPGKISAALRYETLVFWVHTDSQTLNERLAARVDNMVSMGLLGEVQQMRDFYKRQEKLGIDVDTSKGICVAIGYKEFEAYIHGLEQGETEPRLEILKDVGIEKTKIATRQYSKRQNRWIKLKLLPTFRDARVEDKFFALDGTNLGRWQEDVHEKAYFITESFLAREPLPEPTSTSAIAHEVLSEVSPAKENMLQAKLCELCNVTCASTKAWDQHTRSKKHKGLLQRQRNPDRLERLRTRSQTLSPTSDIEAGS